MYFNFRKMHFIVFFTLFSGLTTALIIPENVVFHKANEIAQTRSKWLSIFTTDMKTYDNFLNRLLEDLGKVRISAQFYHFLSKQDCRRIIKGWKGDIVALLNDQHTLVENYIELHAIHTKMKKSLIPIIDKGLSYLFGTATESDLNTIHSSVSRLVKRRHFHVVDKISW